jgi:hypothetical protein
MKLLKPISNLFKKGAGSLSQVGRTNKSNAIKTKPFPNAINICSFYDNLLITQQYCEQQLSQSGERPVGIILKNYNNRELFDFKEEVSYGEKFTSACWVAALDVIKSVHELFLKQLEYKTAHVSSTKLPNKFDGRIVVVDYEATVVDGASEHASHGFFDLYDLPPIDTWFYITKNNKG